MKAGLIGQGIGGSLTPAMHEAEGRAQGLQYTYDRFDTGTDRFGGVALADIVAMAEAQGYAGVNITHPFKVEAVALLDELSEQVTTIGAVNTMLFRGGRRIGHNTDYAGFGMALKNGLRNASLDSVLLLGAGGAGAAVALALVDEGVRDLQIADTDHAKVDALASRLRRARPDAGAIVALDIAKIDLAVVDGVVNTTPMGMADHPGTAIATTLLSPRLWVADIVYFPLETELLAAAKACGCKVMNGAGMAVYQAVEAFALITGHRADAARMAASFDRLYRERHPKLEEQAT